MPATQVKNDISNYTPAEILAISFEVFDAQGFVKSGFGKKCSKYNLARKETFSK